ncbi:oxidoreductase [Serratia entomophila]|uniref:SDR family NAD(P)-dependent oxidoreductase n=1 Tax=Serratia entomophila TaxID=42906 RepID=A0ABY5CVR2_9GAMM|nr:oxidoreductase [Serratia entomophila]USV02278.1 SDR family NAD(P)-dependent oxidoreductase [Serratia entomophila]CAI0745118.1 3-oxoacyl-[acyl-carrier-protein] reductase FabG [Serratia entomophila]CAI0759063.1 3-oxoacyl-[acyl-carrier-protein] reductase FabG [Serratia entomophila]CAI0776935.1 3-oxoacyl-[acyl-carrier-protein] reductase FabG [Serratia entomophila]CAI0953089.1 3-oxoacyl-[acyl-carrier-protein] reductase FabG [Serratia entomophila]
MSQSQVWLITGSSRGLGQQLAQAVLAAGHRLVATARQPQQLQALADRYGDQVVTVALDVTDAAAAQRAVQTAVERFGRLDVLVNNAGYGNIAPVEEADEADFRAQIDTNFYGVFNVTRAALPLLRRQGGGHIIQISTIGARLGVPGLSAYHTAKWAVEGFSESLAKEIAPFGVKLTMVEPGGFRTDWAGSSMTIAPIGAAYQPTLGPMLDYLQQHNGHQPGDPAKAAQAILQLAALEKPPLRLLLGSDAVHLAGQVLAERAAEDAAFRALSLSTDRDDSQPDHAAMAALVTGKS